MDNRPLQEFPQENEGGQIPTKVIEGEAQKGQPGLVSRWMESLAHWGLGEMAVRIGTNALTILLVIGVAWLMQFLYHQTNLGWIPNVEAAPEVSPTPALDYSLLPVADSTGSSGIARLAELHTIIPSRPRVDVIEYTVQQGDSVFGIAEKFNLKPSTILFGNYDTLKLSPDLLKPGQVLNILPVDGAYYEYQGNETLTGIANGLGVDPEAIVNAPANHLDPDTIDYAHPNIAAGAWLVVPGGRREFTSWTAPAQLVRMNPSVHVWGEGACSGITTVQVGYGTFIYPTIEHWLSGTPFLPEIKHNGVDFAGSMGNPIYATDAGTVVYAGWNDWGYGNLVILDHGNGWQSLYGHLSQINVSCGQNVGQGDIIALMGSTGHSTGPHLHFELMNVTYGYVNPLDWVQ